MGFRNDIFIDWYKRIVWIDLPSTKLTIADLITTCRTLEAGPQNSNDVTVFAAVEGYTEIGIGLYVGLTVVFNNFRVAFAARTTSVESGSVTTGDPNGRLLNDSTAQFITNGVEEGALVINLDDGSAATVRTVVSETQLETDRLNDGTLNTYGMGDGYKIWNVVQCEITGGNLGAIDDLGQRMSPIHTTWGTQVNYVASADATLIGIGSIAGDVADAVADEVLTKDTHDVPESLGRRVREMSDSVVAASGLAIAGGSPSEVRTNLTQADGFFDNMALQVINAAGTATRGIEEYQQTNGAFFLDAPLPFTPAADDQVYVLSQHGKGGYGSSG